MKDDFQKRVIITILDFQFFALISFFFYVFGRVFIDYDFFKDYGLEIRVISYFVFFIYFDFRQQKTLAMKIYNYRLRIPENIDLMTKIKYEILNFIDVLLSPYYMILSIFSDKKNRLLMKEKYTEVRMEKQ